MPKKTAVELIENFLVVWESKKGAELYAKGYYGKPLGIAKPKAPDFDVPLILDLMEGLFLSETRTITVYENQERKVTSSRLRQIARELYSEFEEKYLVYHDLRSKGLVVTPGIKFGCDFAVYKQGPGVEHAPYMVSVKEPDSSVTATEIVRTGRLATTVRKRFIIAVPDLKAKKVDYIIFEWFKA